MADVKIRWAKGGEAKLLALDPSTVRLWSSIPSPPGSRIEGTTDEDTPAVIKVKIHVSRALPEAQGGGFLLEGRPLDLPKEVRDRLARSLS